MGSGTGSREMTEAQLQTLVLQAARTQGVLAYHTHDSRRSQPGFPDLVLVGRAGVLYRELKTEKGKLSDDQEHWLASLVAAGEDACTWRPHDWPTRIMSELRALGRVMVPRQEPSQSDLRRHLATRADSRRRGGTSKVPEVGIVLPDQSF